MTANSPTASRRVLVADDDPVTLRLVCSVLRQDGYEPVEAADGGQALRTLNADSDFGAAIFDVRMPRLDGLDLVRHMRTENRLRRIPVLMMTSETDPRVVADGFASGALAYLPKPFTRDQLRVALQVTAGRPVARGAS